MTSSVASGRASLPDARRSVACRPLRLAVGGLSAPGLPAGTRVQLTGGNQLTGTVMAYQRECVPGWLGLFPVRLEVSRRRESHPPPLAEPCVKVALHTAPTVEPVGIAP